MRKMMNYPDIPLNHYFHCFGVDNGHDARMAIGLISRHGLYSLSKDFGLGNISGDLSYSLEYGKESPVQILTVLTNAHGQLSRSGAGTAEYGITARASKVEKASLIADIDKLLATEPSGGFLKEFRDSLRFLEHLLPADELYLALSLDSGGREFLNEVWKEIDQKRGFDSGTVGSVETWLGQGGDRTLYLPLGVTEEAIASTLTRTLFHNEVVGQLYEIYASVGGSGVK